MGLNKHGNNYIRNEYGIRQLITNAGGFITFIYRSFFIVGKHAVIEALKNTKRK